MPRYIETGLNECTTPASNDWMPIVDVSATGDEDRRVSVGKFALLAAANTFTAGIVAPNFRSHNLSLGFNDAVSIAVPASGLLVFVCPLVLKGGGIVGYYSPGSGSANAEIYAQAATGSVLAVTPNVVLGDETTTGVDGKINVNPVIGGTVWIKNRTASLTSMQILVIG